MWMVSVSTRIAAGDFVASVNRAVSGLAWPINSRVSAASALLQIGFGVSRYSPAQSA
jgi:hypothetical protein